MKSQQDKSNNVRLIQNDQRQETCEISLDQSKRMVTIRRINVPHAEPQVTVTAKGISPDKDKLLYTFINGQLIPSANVANSPPTANVMANVNAINANAVKSKQNAKVEPPSNAKQTAKKSVEPVLPEKNAKKSAKEKPVEKNAKISEKTNGRKASPENSKPSTSKSTKTTTNAAATIREKEKEKEKDKEKDKKQKKGKKDVESEVDTITNSTKELTINEEKPKKEKKKVKAVKFEYADPNYKVNQFDLLDMDEDDDYYIESSSDESSEEEPASPVIRPAPVVKTPQLSNQSSIESQSAQTNKTNKNQPVAKNTKAVEPTTKKGKNDANAKTQSQKSDKKPLAESNTAPTVKSQKPQNNQAQQVTVPAAKTTAVDDSNLSKKQKKKLEKKQNTAQTQQQPNATRSSSRAVSVKL